jgi:hypothetical protein
MPVDGTDFRWKAPRKKRSADRTTLERRQAAARDALRVLHGVVRLLRDGDGWIIGRETDGSGRYCLVASVRVAARRMGAVSAPAYHYLGRAIAEVVGKRTSMAAFNDTDDDFARIKRVIDLALASADKAAKVTEDRLDRPELTNWPSGTHKGTDREHHAAFLGASGAARSGLDPSLFSDGSFGNDQT